MCSYALRGAQVRGGQNFLCEGGLQWQPRHLIGRHRATVVFQTTQAHCGVAPSQWYATEPGGAHSAQGHCGVAPSRWFAIERGSAHSAQGHCGVAPSHDVVQVVLEQMGKVADVALAAVHCGGGAGAWRLALAQMKIGGQDRDMDKASFE